jgi:hypothetical protein
MPKATSNGKTNKLNLLRILRDLRIMAFFLMKAMITVKFDSNQLSLLDVV